MTTPWRAAPLPAALVLAAMLVASTAPSSAHAAEIKIISANGLRAVLADIAPGFRAATGHTLAGRWR